MRCETTSSVTECALRARSGDVHVARVVPLVVDAVVGLTLGLIAHVIVVVFVVAILHRIFCIWRYTLYTYAILSVAKKSCKVCPGRRAIASYQRFARNRLSRASFLYPSLKECQN